MNTKTLRKVEGIEVERAHHIYVGGVLMGEGWIVILWRFAGFAME
jgi:hypothetical protein